MRYVALMKNPRFHPVVFALFLGAAPLAGCASVDLPEIQFMGENSFQEEMDALDSSYPSVDEIPAVPVQVRSAQEWDESAREMQRLFDADDAPFFELTLSDEEFKRQFEAAKAATSEYKKDDPQ